MGNCFYQRLLKLLNFLCNYKEHQQFAETRLEMMLAIFLGKIYAPV